MPSAIRSPFQPTHGGARLRLSAAAGGLAASTVTTLSPAGLDRTGTRVLGALKVNPTLAPAGLAATRALGTIAVGNTSVLGLVHGPGRSGLAVQTVTVSVLRQAPRPQIITVFQPPVTLSPAGLDRTGTRAQGAPAVNPTVLPAGQAHTRTLGAPVVSTQLLPAGLVHTRAQGAPTVNPKLAPAGLDRSGTRAQGGVAVSTGTPFLQTVYGPGRSGLAVQAVTVTYQAGRRTPASSVLGGAAPSTAPQPASLDHSGVRALGDPTVQVPGAPPAIFGLVNLPGHAGFAVQAIPVQPRRTEPQLTTPYWYVPLGEIDPASLDRTATRTLGAPTVGSTSVLSLVHGPGRAGLAVQAVTTLVPRVPPKQTVTQFFAASATLQPAGLDRSSTRALGAPAVNPKLGPAGQTHTRAQGAVTVDDGLFPVRRLGHPAVTVVWIPRPVGLAHTRGVGDPVVNGKHVLTPVGLAHTRTQGSPVAFARMSPASLTRIRAQGSPSVNPVTLSPASITRTRGQGSHTLTSVLILRPASQTHTRTVGAPVAHGKSTLTPTGLSHTRAQGNPTLSGRCLPASITRTRSLGSISVNVRTLTPTALARA